MRLPAYILVSGLIFLMLCAGFIYSVGFYPNQHPIPCLIKTYTGKDCPSCGFSKAFSQYSHLQIEEGRNINERSFPVLLFFLFQFSIRSAVLLRFFTTHKIISSQLIKIDLIISISFFLLAFLPLLIITN
jgi:Protein of unknown function (DUF2752)